MIVLVEYGGNENRLGLRKNVHWMVFHSVWKDFHQRQLLAIHQFSEPE